MSKITEATEYLNAVGTEDWTDDDGEIRELTEADFKTMVPFAKLPAEMQEFLLQIKDATIHPDARPEFAEEVTLKLSSPVLTHFRARGIGWESGVDAALREWMEEHKAS